MLLQENLKGKLADWALLKVKLDFYARKAESDSVYVNSNPGSYLKVPWVAAASLNHLLKGSWSSPQPWEKTYGDIAI